jgi:hypothetical protein
MFFFFRQDNVLLFEELRMVDLLMIASLHMKLAYIILNTIENKEIILARVLKHSNLMLL